jgi:hypothetical protein
MPPIGLSAQRACENHASAVVLEAQEFKCCDIAMYFGLKLGHVDRIGEVEIFERRSPLNSWNVSTGCSERECRWACCQGLRAHVSCFSWAW